MTNKRANERTNRLVELNRVEPVEIKVSLTHSNLYYAQWVHTHTHTHYTAWMNACMHAYMLITKLHSIKRLIACHMNILLYFYKYYLYYMFHFHIFQQQGRKNGATTLQFTIAILLYIPDCLLNFFFYSFIFFSFAMNSSYFSNNLFAWELCRYFASLSLSLLHSRIKTLFFNAFISRKNTQHLDCSLVHFFYIFHRIMRAFLLFSQQNP